MHVDRRLLLASWRDGAMARRLKRILTVDIFKYQSHFKLPIDLRMCCGMMTR
jgi:hypothetical protein